jgi:muramoyltetrapeptide carboxypeptidase LdcA involved in peptidoglycan recycling
MTMLSYLLMQKWAKMPKYQFHEMLDQLAQRNRATLIKIIALAKHQKGHTVMWDDAKVFPDDVGWKIRILRMIKDLCWFYDRMEGHDTAQLETRLNEILMEIKGQE